MARNFILLIHIAKWRKYILMTSVEFFSYRVMQHYHKIVTTLEMSDQYGSQENCSLHCYSNITTTSHIPQAKYNVFAALQEHFVLAENVLYCLWYNLYCLCYNLYCLWYNSLMMPTRVKNKKWKPLDDICKLKKCKITTVVQLPRICK